MNNKNVKLTKEEQEIDNFLAKRKITPISEVRKNELQKMAADFLQKSKKITLRMQNSDLQKIKVKAIEKGLPYQTLISSVIHQYVNDKLREDYK